MTTRCDVASRKGRFWSLKPSAWIKRFADFRLERYDLEVLPMNDIERVVLVYFGTDRFSTYLLVISHYFIISEKLASLILVWTTAMR